MRCVCLMVLVLTGCGARTGFVTSDDAAVVVDAPDALIDASSDATEVLDVPPACPLHRPIQGESCVESLEGESCLFGTACRVECVCERGSWVCASDPCVESCPARTPASLPCPLSEIDRVCVYPRGCPTTCRCDAFAGAARWNCISPPC